MDCAFSWFLACDANGNRGKMSALLRRVAGGWKTTTHHDVGFLLRITANAVGCFEIDKCTTLVALGCAFAKVVVAVDVS
jgi:hypothetical protein